MTNQTNEETTEKIDTISLPVNHPDVIALAEHIEKANEIANRNGWPSILIALSCIHDNGRKGTMGAICSTIGPGALTKACMGFGSPKGILIAVSMLEANQAIKNVRHLLESTPNVGGETISEALAAIRAETTDAGAQA